MKKQPKELTATLAQPSKEIVAIINLALKAYSRKNKQHLKNIQEELELRGIPCVILQDELVGLDGELCWSQMPGSNLREYFYNRT